MSIASEISRIQGAKSDLKTSIEAKGVPVPDATKIDGYAALVDQISGGGSTEVEENDVIFIDYDGTRVYSYSKSDFLALSALPSNPSHTGLTAQGWNWTLADAKDYVSRYGMLIIGQLYVTSDGKTRLYIKVEDEIKSRTIYWYQTAANGVTLDWGDGSATETAAGTGNKNATHTYASAGDYVIKFYVSSGTLSLGNGSDNYAIFGSSTARDTSYARQSLYKVEFGSGITSFATSTFKNCFQLAAISVPSTMTSVNGLAGCSGLKGLVLNGTSLTSSSIRDCIGLRYYAVPKGMSFGQLSCYNNKAIQRISIAGAITIGQSAFSDLVSMKHLIIGEGATTIGNTAIMNNESLETITIPSTVTSIGNSCFANCVALRTIILKPTTPPTAGTTIFSGCDSSLKIWVPYSADHSVLTNYKGTSNWIDYASQIYELDSNGNIPSA